MNILEKANEIVNKRSEEKERQYGPFSEGMERAAMILSGMTGVNVNAEFMYKALVALKFSRESYSHKEDNLLDSVAYIGALNNYHEEKKPIDKEQLFHDYAKAILDCQGDPDVDQHLQIEEIQRKILE